MAFRPLEWDALANDIAASGATEAERRTAVGRLYYAMFGESLLALARKGLLVPREDGTDHARVLRTLTENKRGSASVALDNLRRLRNTADYDYKAEVTAASIDRARALAESVKRLCAADWESP
jgi:hypothetical protein